MSQDVVLFSQPQWSASASLCQDENKAYQMQLQFLEHVPLMKRLPKALGGREGAGDGRRR